MNADDMPVDRSGVVTNDLLTEEQLLDLLQQAQTAAPDIEPGTITRSEIQQIMGVNESKAYRVVKALRSAGVLGAAWVQRVDEWDVRRRVRGYRLLRPLESPQNGATG